MEENKMSRLIKKIKIQYTIKVLTGLHIGGSSDNVEIGGIDNPVIKLGDGKPYIPGSSLKGKIRSLLEQSKGATTVGDNSEINKLFGASGKDDATLSKVIFRDFYLTDDSIEELDKSDYLPMPYTENKYENVIGRLTGKAQHLRQTERVPAGAKFEGEIILNIWDDNDDNEQKFTKMLEEGISLLENDYLGGSGSRGYGQVKLEEIKRGELSDDNNWKEQNKE